MAVDMFMKIGDIKGEAKDDKHKDEIDVLSWSWGMSQGGSMHGAGGTGKVQVNDVSFTKWIDKASPILMKMCCNGKVYPEALLTVRKAGENALEYIKIKMERVQIRSVQTGGGGNDDHMSENVTLNFAKVSYDYTPQKEDGSGEAAIKMGWDISANKAIG